MNCVFCKIAAGEIPVDEVYRDADVVAFRDLNPQAPVHILIIPTRHVASAAEASEDVLGALMAAAAQIAGEHIDGNGYRIVTNIGPDGGQSVDHLHLHVLGGRKMGWPPG
ncbi:MAG TPA: HIT domain-containing protein [Armatimonadota bacterium]|jgi:histidine triad (HIT) family protein